MAVISNLDQHYIETQLVCPSGKSKIEVVDPQRTGLYIEVRAVAPNQGTYYLRYKDANGKTARKRLGRTTELALEAARAEAIRLKTEARGSTTQTAAAPPKSLPSVQPSIDGSADKTLDAFMTDNYFPHVKIRKRSWKRDEQLYRLRIKAKFGHLQLRQIARYAVQQFQDALVLEGLAPASVNQHVQLLRRICNLALSWQMLEKNVLARIPMLHLDNEAKNFLDDAQVHRLVAVLRTDKNRMVSLVLLFLLATGARLNEGLCAKWKQVDQASGIWTIPASNSKSKKLKHLPLNASALWVIGQLESEGQSEFLFPSPASGKPFTTITRQWYRLRKKADLPDGTRIHDLRHTFASRMIKNGRSLYDVKELLGHADARTSQRYSHLSMETKREASAAAAFAVG